MDPMDSIVDHLAEGCLVIDARRMNAGTALTCTELPGVSVYQTGAVLSDGHARLIIEEVRGIAANGGCTLWSDLPTVSIELHTGADGLCCAGDVIGSTPGAPVLCAFMAVVLELAPYWRWPELRGGALKGLRLRMSGGLDVGGVTTEAGRRRLARRPHPWLEALSSSHRDTSAAMDARYLVAMLGHMFVRLGANDDDPIVLLPPGAILRWEGNLSTEQHHQVWRLCNDPCFRGVLTWGGDDNARAETGAGA